MKKTAALLLALLMLISFPGCSKSTGPVNESGEKIVTLVSELLFQDYVDAVISEFETELEGIEVQVEYLPELEDEREPAITRIRAEIMSGEGPDVFLLNTGNQTSYSYPGHYSLERQLALMNNEKLFPNAESAMYNGVFLPLDEYLSGEYLKFDERVEAVMSTGRTDRGQVLLPLTYEYEMLLINKNILNNKELDVRTWEQLVACDEPAIRDFMAIRGRAVHSALGDFVDYDNFDLSVSKEEFSEMLMETDKLMRRGAEVTQYSFTALNYGALQYDSILSWNYEQENYVAMAVPNLNDNITAYLNSFVAVNSNCSHVEESVKLAELFFYKNGPKLDNYTMTSSLGLSTLKSPYIDFVGTEVERILQENAQRIDNVCFTPLYTDSMGELFHEMHYGSGLNDKLIEETYTKLRMIVAE